MGVQIQGLQAGEWFQLLQIGSNPSEQESKGRHEWSTIAVHVHVPCEKTVFALKKNINRNAIKKVTTFLNFIYLSLIPRALVSKELI
jgi:hypothetical protein